MSARSEPPSFSGVCLPSMFLSLYYENIKGKDYEIENFKSINACTRFINKHYKRLDKYNIDKDYGIYKKL